MMTAVSPVTVRGRRSGPRHQRRTASWLETVILAPAATDGGAARRTQRPQDARRRCEYGHMSHDTSSRTGSSDAARKRWTISSCAATTALRPTSSPLVDDAAQGIGEVVRGADLADSTPRQILLTRLLACRSSDTPTSRSGLPSWPDGRRLAKRHGAVTLSDRAALGEGPEQARAWMARSLGLARVGDTVTGRPHRRLRSRTTAARTDLGGRQRPRSEPRSMVPSFTAVAAIRAKS